MARPDAPVSRHILTSHANTDLSTDRLADLGDRLRHVGARRLDGLGRCGNGRVARGGRPPGLHVLRHGLGLRRGPQRAAAGGVVQKSSEPGPAAGHEGAAEKRALDSAGRLRARRGLPARSRARVHREEPEEPWRGRHRRAAVPRVERRLGERGSVAADARGPEAGGQGPQLGHQRQPLGADQRPEGARHGAHRFGTGGLQHLRPGA